MRGIISNQVCLDFKGEKMFILETSTKFDAAHRLKSGKCSQLHGHTWEVGVKIASEVLDDEDMMVDVHELDETVERALGTLDFDHHFLNDLNYFKTKQCWPTMERIAEAIFACLENRFPPNIKLVSVSVREGGKSVATFVKNEYNF